MADYIDKNILSQAYIHVEPKGLDSEQDLLVFKEHIQKFVETRTAFYLHPDMSIKVEFEEGSLKARITVFGAIGILLQAVSSYPDLRQGIALIYGDSKRLAEYIVSEVQFSTKAKHEDVIRLEARTGIIGSLHKILSQLESIKRSAELGVPVTEITPKIEQVHEEIEELIRNINVNDASLIKNGIHDLSKKIPLTPKEPKDKVNLQQDIALYRDRRRKLVGLFEKAK